MLKKIISNTIANYLLKAIQLFLNLLAIPILINNLGEEGFGIILFASIVVGYFNVLELGITDGVTKYVSQYIESKEYNKIQSIINTSLIFFIGIGFLVSLTLIIWVLSGGVSWLNLDPDLSVSSDKIFLFASVIALISWPQLLLKGIFKGIQDFITLNILIGIGRIISVVSAILAVIYTDWEIEYIFLLFNLDKIILTFIQFKILKKKLPFWKFSVFDFNKDTFRFIFSFSGWIMLGQLAVMLEYQSDQLVILSFLSASFLATYAVAFYLFRMIQQISGLAGSAVMPAISQLNESSNSSDIKKIIFFGVKMHNLFFVPITLTLFFIAEPFIKLWVGVKYLDYLWLIKLSIIFQLIWQSSALFGQIYLGLGYSRKPGIIGIIVGLLNVTTSIILVNYIGVSGVILGTICVGVLSVPIAMFWMLKDVDISFKDYFLKLIVRTQFPLIIGSLFFFIVLDWINNIDTWFMLVFVSFLMLVYLFSIGYFFCLNKNEKFFLKKINKK
tara:strand:- start:7408 stop:8910 length:1503 start_codon:yes stop_codon:yes gene_type:complete